MATLNEPSLQGTSSGSDPRCQDTILGDAEAQTRFETAFKQSNDPPLSRVNTLRSGENRLQLKELMELCTKLSDRVLDLENTKTAQAQEITSLKKRVKKLEKKKKSRTHRLRRLYKVGLSARIVSLDDEASLGDQEDASKQWRKIHDIDADEDITLDSTHFDTDPDMFRVHDLKGDEVVVEHMDASASEKVFVAEQSEKVVEEVVSTTEVNAATTTSTIPVSAAKDLTDVDMTLAQALAKLKNLKPKAVTTAATTTTTAVTSPKAKGIVIQEQEQDKVETDYELAQRLQAEEQEELTIKENSKLFQQLWEKRRKNFVAKRAEEKRNRPPIKTQQRSIMCTYLKNMAGWKPKDLKTKSFATIQDLFDKAMKRVNTFVDMDIELVGGSEVRAEGSETREESSSKRAGDELEHEKAKKQKMDDDKEREDLQQCFKIVTEEDVAIDDIPLATKLTLLEVTVAHIEVIAVKLMMLVYKLLLLVIRVNDVGSKLQLLTELQLLKDYNCWKDKDCLKNKNTYVI
ncbi:hypothetical protein Tco_1197631, partial [Tanacetum coccineum]